MNTDLTQKTFEINWPITIFKVVQSDQLCDILVEEANRFMDNETFRVQSKHKKKAKLLLSLCYEKIWG